MPISEVSLRLISSCNAMTETPALERSVELIGDAQTVTEAVGLQPPTTVKLQEAQLLIGGLLVERTRFVEYVNAYRHKIGEAALTATSSQYHGSSPSETGRADLQTDPVDYSHRQPIPEDQRPWDKDLPDYTPPAFTSDWVKTTGVELGMSDPDSPADVDFSTRPSFVPGGYTVNDRGYPQNPMGRQGIADRGDLAMWGPNYAADPVVVAQDPTTGRHKILLIRRGDTEQFALPGGMVDPGEPMGPDTADPDAPAPAVGPGSTSVTATRELQEEAGINLREVPSEVIYEGYVDDPRNTDNAWMETSAHLFRLQYTPEAQSGDDAVDARWFNCDSMEELLADIARLEAELGRPVQPLYASHGGIIQEAIHRLTPTLE